MKFTGGLIELFTIVGWTPQVFKQQVDNYVRSQGCQTAQDILTCLKSLTFTSSVCGGILQCCPPQAKENEIFRDIHLFCLPRGIKIQNVRGPTTSHNFVLTNVKGDRYNACALSFFEPVEYSYVATGEKSKTIKSSKEQLWFNKAICVVSKYAFSDMLKDFLIGIYEVIFHEKQSTIPIECFVNALLWQLPVLQHPLNLELIMKVGTRVLRIPPQPTYSHFPFVNFSMQEFFLAMDVNNIMKIFAAILTEKQILFSSSSYTLLYLATETITTLLFPFNWYHVYVPLLPNNLVDYLGAPTPFIMGIHADMLPVVSNYGADIVIVDLDSNSVEHSCDIPILPIEAVQLRKNLVKLLKPNPANLDIVESFENVSISNNNNNSTTGNNNPTEENWDEIQKKIRVEFFLFFATVLSSYKHFISEDEFVKDEFIQFQPKASQPFLEMFVDTQAFSQFRHNPAMTKLFDAALEYNAITMADLQKFLMQHFFERGNEYMIKVPLLHPGGALGASSSFDNKLSMIGPAPHLDLAKVGGTSSAKILQSSDDLALRNRRGIYGTWKKHDKLDLLLLNSKDFNPKDFLMMYENKFPDLEEELTARASDFRMLVTDLTKNLEQVLKTLESLSAENSNKQKLTDTALSFYFMRAMLFLESKQILLALQDLEKILELSASFSFNADLLDYLVETLEELESSPEFYQSNKVYPLSVGDRVRKLIAEHAASLRTPRMRSKSVFEDIFDDWQEIHPKSYQEDMEDIAVFLDSLPLPQQGTEAVKLSQTDFMEFCHNNHFPYKRKLILKIFNLLKDPKTALINVDKLIKALLDIKARRPKYQNINLIDYREICFMQGTASNSHGARGSLILTNEKLIFVDKQHSGTTREEISDVCIKLDSIVSVEKYNFIVVIPPGVPCVRIHYKPAKSTQTKTVTFCILKERHVWYRIIKEITLAFRISRDLNEPRILMQTFHKVMLTEAICMINKKPAKGLLSLYNSSTEWMTIKKVLESEPMNVLNEPPKEPMELKRTPSGHIAAGPMHPLEIAEIMLISAVELFFTSLAVDGCHIEFGKVLNSPEYTNFKILSTLLHNVDLSQLTTQESYAFFLNIFNCLTIHSLLLVGFPVNKTEWRYLTRSACYTIGSLPFTLDFIKHGILRANQFHSLPATSLNASGSRKGTRDERSPSCPSASGTRGGRTGEFLNEDPRLVAVKNAPKFLDARIHFAISFHNRSSPPIRLFKPDKLDAYLNVATAEFLQEFVVISEKTREVTLPKVFKWYRNDFGGSDMLDWILLHLNGTQKKELNNLMTDLLQSNKPFKVTYKYDWSPFPRPFRQFL